MAIDVSQYTIPIKTAVMARDVRDNIADGMDAIATEVNNYEEQLSSDNDQFKEDIDKRQTNLEDIFNQEIANQTVANPSNAETVAARTDNITNKTYDTLGKRLDDQSSQLADIPNQVYITEKAKKTETFNILEELMEEMSYLRNDGTFHLIGDSITAGYGLPYTQQYATKLLNVFNNLFVQKVNDNEIITNMWDEPTLTKGGGYSGTAGSLGCCSQSTILQPGNTIAFTSSTDYVDVIFHKQPSAGQLEFYDGSVLIKTIDCSGTEDTNATSFPSATFSGNNNSVTIKCINANVEILGVIRISSRIQYGNFYKFRHAVGGENTTFFTDETRLNAIKNVDNFISPTQKTYMLAIGTNDIYNPSKVNTPTQYSANLELIIKELLSQTAQVRIILVVPAIPSSSWTAANQHQLYTKALYQLAKKYNCTVIDFMNYNFIAANDYQDGLHYNNAGTDIVVDVIKKTIANEGVRIPFGIKRSASFTKTTYSIANNTSTKIPLDETYYNDYITVNNGNVVIDEDGVYSITATGDFASNATGFRMIYLKINGLYYAQQYVNTLNGNDTAVSTSYVTKLSVGDTVELDVMQTSGVALNGTFRLNIAKI